MTSKPMIALAFLCLSPLAAFAETAPATPAAKPAATLTAPAAAPAPSTAAVADKSEGAGSKRWQACAADVQKFCGTLEKGKGVVHTCLESHAAELSPGCKTSMSEHAGAKSKATDAAAAKPAEAPAAKAAEVPAAKVVK